MLGYVPATLAPAPGIYVSAGLSTEQAFEEVNRATRWGVGLVVAGPGAGVRHGLGRRPALHRPADRAPARRRRPLARGRLFGPDRARRVAGGTRRARGGVRRDGGGDRAP